MKIHEKYIKRCIQLSKNGLSTAMPNPSVGAVIICEDKIIGEGYTAAYGGNHAEVNAIKSVKNKKLLSKSTLYVSLEPCSHFGKTPPCADLIIENKIPNVVIGVLDSNEKVAGKGVQKLKDAGINVIVGILENECYEANKRFFSFHNKKRPYIILKWAESFDGFIAPKNQEIGKPFFITNEISRQLVHKWRSEEMAILVGTTTVLKDNPKLDVRNWSRKNPVRIVLDKTGKISDNYFVKDNLVKTIVFTENEVFISNKNKIYEMVPFNENLVSTICDILYKHQIQSVIIEGGTKTLQTFIDANLWDEARVFRSNILIEDGTKAPNIRFSKFEKSDVSGDLLTKFFNKI